MKKIFTVILLIHLSTLVFSQEKGFYKNVQKKHISELLDNLNTFASQADFNKYFELFAEESTFIGTDAKEIWTKKEFMDYAKPHFDKGKTWVFKSVKRNIYISEDGKYAWFDELLDTQMEICRGSGVLQKIGKNWKIKQFVLSMTIPNEVVTPVVEAKKEVEEKYLKELKIDMDNS